MVFEKSSFELLKNFFNEIKFEEYLDDDVNRLRMKIINNCEIGLSQCFIKNNLNIGAVFNCRKFSDQNINIHWILWRELINNQYPLIKKKIVNQNRLNILDFYRF